jgi:hypothetical protein
VAVAALAGVGWVVQLVVYPAFALVGDAEWPDYHRRHQQAITCVVLLPWLVQGVSTVALLLEGPTLSAIALAVLAAATVVLTAAGAVPAHTRLTAARTPQTLRALLRANLWRTLAWTASAATAAVIAAVATW